MRTSSAFVRDGKKATTADKEHRNMNTELMQQQVFSVHYAVNTVCRVMNTFFSFFGSGF